MDCMCRAASCVAALYQRAVTGQPVRPGGQRQPEPAVLADGHCKARARRIYGHHLPGQRDSTTGRRAAYPDELARHPTDGCRGCRPPGAAPGNRRRRREHGHDRAQGPPHARLDVPSGDLVVPPRDFWPNSTETRPVRHAGAGRLAPPASGSLLIRDVEVQATACCDRVHQGLQLRRRGRLGPCLPPALQRGPRGEPGAYRAQCPRPGRCWWR
jgi:hypothetical protein